MYKGYEVRYVQNFTDVDDKIIQRGNVEGMEPLALGQKYIEEYFKDALALNLLPATVHPKATEHIPEMIEIIQGLINTGLGYEVEGDVYFAVDHFPDYGKLSGRTLEDMKAGARVEVDERKHYPMDFALWKKAKPGEPAWESPWGLGRPGWHIECTAMSLKYLGAGFDIHGGGEDLAFPHHENEIAQTEGYLKGQTFARYWMHNAFLTINQEKMSKSLGNFFTVRELLVNYPGEVIRFYLLGTHYRSPLDFNDQNLVMAQKGLERLQTSVRLAQEAIERVGSLNNEQSQAELLKAASDAREAFEKAMDDDFNSALAYAALFELAKTMNGYVQEHPASSEGLVQAQKTLIELGEVLGLDLLHPANIQVENEEMMTQIMDAVLQIRSRSRQKKDWEMADFIRDVMKEKGILIEDTPQGARWQIKK
ncbi:Cysteinyl-tRNA synthetase [Desulfosporosinus sp. I2]|nr:Cysteinyl-tRNA synthetase [Desulfosporosinus sp. I2]